jgi:sulfopyruvate decarboxylase subunit beta
VKRLDCLKAIYPQLEDCAVVTIMGAVAAELYSLGHRPNFFYLEHAMGLASSIGLGIALSQPDRKVVVLDGDGSVLMNLGGLTTLARSRPNNLVHVIFDNETLLSVGGGAPGGYQWFTTATSSGTDLAAIAKAAGFPRAQLVRELGDFEEAALDAIKGDQLTCIVAKVDAEMPKSFLMDVHMLENRFEFPRALQSKGGVNEQKNRL